MHRFLIFLLSLAALAIPATSWAASTSANLAINVTAAQAITGVSLSNSAFTGGAPSGTVVGAINMTLSPTSPAFSGSLSLSGTNASQFQIVGSNLETNGAVPAGTYNINIVATAAGLTGSPFTQAETVTGTDPATGAQDPGPSAALFNNPYYKCNTNYYVSQSGSDSNNGSAGSPWATLQHADTALATSPPAGTGSWRVNVAPSSTAYAPLDIANAGGTAATSTGYVVYRCQTPAFISGPGCLINNDGFGFRIMQNNGGLNTGNFGPNYIIIDGFTLNATDQATFGQGVQLDNFNNTICCHHIWVLNNVISGYGQSGAQLNTADFVYAIHNTFKNNSSAPNCDSGAQGSGLSIAAPIALSGYTLTANDKSNPVTGNLASQGAYFQTVAMWNLSYNNHMSGCASGASTDGNGIIADTWNGWSGGPPVYAHQALLAFNLVFNNGGQGIKLAGVDNAPGTPSVGITVANNTVFNDSLDTTDTGQARGEIEEQFGSNDTIINNIVFANRTTSGATQYNNDYIGDSSGGFASHFTNDVGYCTNYSGACYSMFNGAIWSSGKDPANPDWVNVGNTSAGSQSTPPVGANFALQSGSPAIGFGLTEPYLPPSSVDAGACSSVLSTCP